MNHTTGNVNLPPWATHLVAMAGAAVVFFAADKNFMALFPAWVSTVATPLVSFLTYAGITQINSKPAA